MQTNASPKPERKQIGVGGFTINARGKELVMQALENNRLSAGPLMAKFESELAALHGCQFGLMCNSGTSARCTSRWPRSKRFTAGRMATRYSSRR